MDFQPRDYESSYKVIEDLKDAVKEVYDADFSDCANDFVSGIESCVSEIGGDSGVSDYISRNSGDIAKNAEEKIVEIKTAVKAVDDVQSNFINSVIDDFSDKLRFYTVLVEKGVLTEEDDIFPFTSWVKEIGKISEGYSFSSWEIYDQIERMFVVNKELANFNIAEQLSSLLGFKKPTGELKRIAEFFNEFLPGAFLNVLSGKGYGDFVKALSGEKVELNESSSLFFKYAAALPGLDWKFKDEEFNGKVIKKCSNNWDEIFEHFGKTELWNKIKLSESFQKKLIDEMLDYSDGSNKIYNISFAWTNRRGARVERINWDVAKSFAKHVLKDSLVATDYFVSKIASDYRKEEPDISNHLTEIMSLALHAKLQEDLATKSEIKEKKMKV